MFSLKKKKICGTLYPFHSIDLILYCKEMSENLWFTDVFRRYRKEEVPWNELNR